MKSVSASHGEWDDPPEKSHLQLKDTSWQVLAQTKPAGQKNKFGKFTLLETNIAPENGWLEY